MRGNVVCSETAGSQVCSRVAEDDRAQRFLFLLQPMGGQSVKSPIVVSFGSSFSVVATRPA